MPPFNTVIPAYGLISNTRLNGVSAARRNRVNPAVSAMACAAGSPAWLPARLRLRPGTLRRVRTGTSSGQPVKIRFDWTDITATSARFERAFSYIEGQSWQTNWILTMTRQD